MKACRKCGTLLPANDFMRDPKSVDGLWHTCKSCRNTQHKAQRKRRRELTGVSESSSYRQGNLDKHRQIISAGRQRNIRYVNSKKRGPCTDCGRTFPPVCMDFDHVGDNKIMSVALMAQQRRSLAAIQAEIDKCELVCACCHRIRTAQRAGWKTEYGEGFLLLTDEAGTA